MVTISLLQGKIRIETEGHGSIKSDIPRETCPSCGQTECCFSCDGSQGADDVVEEEADVVGRLMCNGGLDALESVLLAAACRGLVVENEEYKWDDVIQTTLDAMGSNT